MKTETETKIKYNLFAKIVDNKVIDIIMPDMHGQMDEEAPGKLNWYAIKWPVNPHFTGKSKLIVMIEDMFPLKTPV